MAADPACAAPEIAPGVGPEAAAAAVWDPG